MNNVVHAIIITALIYLTLSIISLVLFMVKLRIENFLAIRRYEKEKREFFQRIAEENAKEMIRLKDKGAE